MSMTVSFKTQLRKGDQVKVVAGKDRGKTGEIISFDTKKGRALVRGINLVKDNKRARTAEEKSQIITREASINISNLAYYDAESSKASKLGYKITDGKKSRYIKSANKVI